jgi:hypothetical protein
MMMLTRGARQASGIRTLAGAEQQAVVDVGIEAVSQQVVAPGPPSRLSGSWHG